MCAARGRRCRYPELPVGGSRSRPMSARGCARKLRPAISALFCHVYGRGKGIARLIPGWPYSFVAALETGRTSWTALLDAVRLGPVDGATAVTALRAVIERLITAGHWRPGDPPILIVTGVG